MDRHSSDQLVLFAQLPCKTMFVKPVPSPLTTVHPSFVEPLCRHRESSPASLQGVLTWEKYNNSLDTDIVDVDKNTQNVLPRFRLVGTCLICWQDLKLMTVSLVIMRVIVPLQESFDVHWQLGQRRPWDPHCHSKQLKNKLKKFDYSSGIYWRERIILWCASVYLPL